MTEWWKLKLAEQYRSVAEDFRRHPELAALAEKAERYADVLTKPR